jgi:hypothetical protein
MPAPDATAVPVQEQVRFTALYANVYADVNTGQIELGARVYRSAAAADERRQQHEPRDGLVFVCVAPVSACVAEALVRAAITAARQGTIEEVTPVVDPNDVDPADSL